MKSFFTLLFAISLISSQAEVVVYRHSMTKTTIGDATTIRTSLGGYTVFEYDDTGAVGAARVVTHKPSKTFYVEYPYWEDWNLDEVYSSSFRSSLVYTEAWTQTDTNNWRTVFNLTMAGVNSAVLIGTDYVALPKSWTFNGRAIYRNESDANKFDVVTGSASLDKKLTYDSNLFGANTDAAVDRIRQQLLIAGYTEVE